ncbi:MAG: helix-turn-helix transcriptional regulator [Lachnospiraceae bacterium]|nr:helix-turn-helix transcriptional regulator [Lachnospiraceae bacterium]
MNILQYENYQEKKQHHREGFPYITYLCTIPLDFPSVPTHWHNEWEIIYIKKGQGCISVDLESRQVSAGDIVLILPGQLHSLSQLNDQSMEYENILFGTELLTLSHNDICYERYFAALEQRTLKLPVVFHSESCTYYDQIAHCIDTADEICKTFPPGYELGLKSCLFRLFYILCSHLSVTDNTIRKPKSLDKLKTVIKYVENHYAEPLSIETMAEICGFSQSHFMKFFKNNMGISFIEYLNFYRLTMAARLLLASGSSIMAIAMECGFDSPSYFNRSFKKKYGMTPREYRTQF